MSRGPYSHSVQPWISDRPAHTYNPIESEPP